ncbi:hypothetical protein HDU97_003990 [Phlyctochytrium planicorne]|nr:hypothetical protein HDU97_003990 [Phlyctochytrium planicorne]
MGRNHTYTTPSAIPSATDPSVVQPPNPTTDSANSSPPTGVIAGASIAGFLILAAIAVALILVKHRKPRSERPEKPELVTQSSQELQSDSNFLVSKSAASSSDPAAVIDMDSETAPGQVQRNGMASSVMKPGGLFSAQPIPSVDDGGQFNAETISKDKVHTDENDKRYASGSTTVKIPFPDARSPHVTQQETHDSTSASAEVFTSSNTSKTDIDQIFDKEIHGEGSLAAPPRGSSMRMRTPTVARQPLSAWTKDEVAHWLYNDIGVRTDVVELLKRLNVDGIKLMTLTDADLLQMGLSQGYARLAILAAVGDISSGVNSSAPSSEVPPPYTGA